MFRPLKAGGPDWDGRTQMFGTSSNANTRFESTVYTTSVPEQNLNRVLQLEAERFQKLRVDDALLKLEREAVRSEYSVKMDSNPIVDLWDAVFRFGYPNHPFGWMIIGFREDLDKIKADDCNKFFARFYRPNNIGLFISGNVDPAKVFAEVEQDYGKWPKGETSVYPAPFENKGKLVVGEGKLATGTNNFLAGFRTAYTAKDNFVEQAVANHVLLGSSRSLLSKRLVHSQKLASAVEPFNFDYDNGFIKALVLANNTLKAEKLADELVALKDDFAGLSDAEFTAYLKEYQVGVAEALEANEGRNAMAAWFWGKYGSLDLMMKASAKPLEITKAKITEYLNRNLTRDNLVIVHNKEQK